MRRKKGDNQWPDHWDFLRPFQMRKRPQKIRRNYRTFSTRIKIICLFLPLFFLSRKPHKMHFTWPKLIWQSFHIFKEKIRILEKKKVCILPQSFFSWWVKSFLTQVNESILWAITDKRPRKTFVIFISSRIW